MRWLVSDYLILCVLLQLVKLFQHLVGCTSPPEVPFARKAAWSCAANGTRPACRMEERRACMCFIQDSVSFTHGFERHIESWIESRKRVAEEEVLAGMRSVLAPGDPKTHWCLPTNRKPGYAWSVDQDALLDELSRQVLWFQTVHFLQWYRYGDSPQVLSNEGWWALIVLRVLEQIMKGKEDGDPHFYWRYFGPFVPLPGISDCVTAHRSVGNWIQVGFLYHKLTDMLREALGISNYCTDLMEAQMTMTRSEFLYVSLQETVHSRRDNVLVLHNSGDVFGTISLPKLLANFRSDVVKPEVATTKDYLLAFMGTWDDGGHRRIRHVLVPMLARHLGRLFHMDRSPNFREAWRRAEFCLVPRGIRRRAFMESECLALGSCVCVYIWDDIELLPYRGSPAHWSNLGLSFKLTPELPRTLQSLLENVTRQRRDELLANARTFSKSHYTFEGQFEQIMGFVNGSSSDLVCDAWMSDHQLSAAVENARDVVKRLQRHLE
ncbi:MAG: uncharacterized protein KVP18_003431 [Porospora cf. gigantea A]|uniref:uncharacterized protein n=1 Tax=Porospora cf. gigantea A TaxID=2853593 RepID=UPI003559ABF9|nr:MAG: hypothetical protein KVP18_003431 [Porospora cf. gigantea A]